MKIASLLTAWLLMALSLTANADGKFKWVIQNSATFIKIELVETNGTIEGKISSTGGSGYIGYGTGPDEIDVTVGSETYVFATSQTGKGLQKTYRGWGEDKRLINGTAYLNPKKQYNSLSGTVEKQNEVTNYKITQSYKKRDFYMEVDRLSFAFSGVKNQPGKAKGTVMWDSMQQTGTIYVESSGTLEDLFFKDPDQVFAWLVNFFVYPAK